MFRLHQPEQPRSQKWPLSQIEGALGLFPAQFSEKTAIERIEDINNGMDSSSPYHFGVDAPEW